MSDPKELLTEDDCKQILRNYLEKDNFIFMSYTIGPLSDTIEGIGGQHFSVKVHYEIDLAVKTAKFFMKTLNPAAKVTFEMCMSTNAYGKEEFFYNHLLSEYKIYGIDVSFAPKAYFCKPYLIVLEDLSLRGFKCAPKKDLFNLEHCKAALRALASFHASGIIYEEIKSKESKYSLLESHPEPFEEMFYKDTNNCAAIWFRCSLDGILEMINLIPENEISKEEYKAKLQTEFDNRYDKVRPTPKYRNTTLHGDLWTNNLLFTYDEYNNPKDCNVIDFQGLKFGPPSIDVVQMIVTDSRKELRDKHFDELLKYYYDHFGKNLAKHGLDVQKVIPYSDFLQCCNNAQVPTRLQAIADHSLTFLSDESYGDALQSDDNLRKFLYEDRSKSMLYSFSQNAQFREILTEDILDLRDLCFSNKVN